MTHSRRPAPKPPPPPLSAWRDPLTFAAIVAMLVVGTVAAIDLILDGKIDAAVLALFISVFGPLTPALVARYARRNGNGSG